VPIPSLRVDEESTGRLLRGASNRSIFISSPPIRRPGVGTRKLRGATAPMALFLCPLRHACFLVGVQGSLRAGRLPRIPAFLPLHVRHLTCRSFLSSIEVCHG
jgi:hypothetical protein